MPDTPFAPHPRRGELLAEAHARPFNALSGPARLLHLGFLTTTAEATADRLALVALCEKNGVEPPSDFAKQHRVVIDGVGLRWEQHAEFTTYTWEHSGEPTLLLTAQILAAPMLDTPQPGPLLVAADLRLLTNTTWEETAHLLDFNAVAVSQMDGGDALGASDFKADADGFVRIVVIDKGLGPMRTGALAQRLLELETYRVLALLGLPEAQRLGPLLRGIEEELPEITRGIMKEDGVAANQRLLKRLISLAATLEADITAALYRFGASRAYYDIVKGRLEAINETSLPGHATISAFLSRRLSPAIRTITTLEERQAALSEKLARAAQLLAAKVQVELGGQNKDLLSTMNRRARLQLRLQHTVEGLSVAAVAYYVLGILSYLFKGAHGIAPWMNPEVASALAAPVVIAGVAMTVLRIRRQHAS